MSAPRLITPLGRFELQAGETLLAALERLLDEYSTADGLDPRRRDRQRYAAD